MKLKYLNGVKRQREICYYKKMRVKILMFFFFAFSIFVETDFVVVIDIQSINVCIFTSVSITSHPLTHDDTKKIEISHFISNIALVTANSCRFEFNCYESLCSIEYKNLGCLNFQLFSKFIKYVLWYLIDNISLESLIYSFFLLLFALAVRPLILKLY